MFGLTLPCILPEHTPVAIAIVTPSAYFTVTDRARLLYSIIYLPTQCIIDKFTFLRKPSHARIHTHTYPRSNYCHHIHNRGDIYMGHKFLRLAIAICSSWMLGWMDGWYGMRCGERQRQMSAQSSVCIVARR